MLDKQRVQDYLQQSHLTLAESATGYDLYQCQINPQRSIKVCCLNSELPQREPNAVSQYQLLNLYLSDGEFESCLLIESTDELATTLTHSLGLMEH